jgi:hypothetical protein
MSMRGERVWQWFFVLLIVATGVAVVVGTVVLYRIPPPVSYNLTQYQPKVAELCAGDWLEYEVVRSVNAAPAVVMTVTSWWSLEREVTAVPTRVPLWSVYTQTGEAARPVRVLVPELEPGAYEYRVASQAVGSGLSVYVVRVTVLPC